MTGGLSLLLTFATAIVPELPQRIGLAVLATLCFLCAAYQVWASEYARAQQADERLKRRRPIVVPEVVEYDTMRGGETLMLNNVGDVAALGIRIDLADESQFGVIFDPVQIIRPGEAKIRVTARPNGVPNLREAAGLKHLAAVSNPGYRERSFEVPLRLS